MKVYSYANRISLDNLRPEQRPDPIPGPHDVVLKMRAVALNYRDVAIARGHYHAKMEAPLIPLSDGAGEVVSAGEKVTRLRVGDLACPVYLPDWIDGPIHPRLMRRRLGGPNDGVLAEMILLNEEEVVRAPAHLDAVEAATLPVSAVTAWHVLYQTGFVRPGETVLVHGSGGVSTAALQFARAGGARVIALTRRDRHEARLRELGANDVVIASDTPDWPKHVVEMTNGEGADVVVDVVGGASLSRSIASIRVGGCVHLVGYTADTYATIDIFDAIRHATKINVAAAGNRQSFEALVRAMELQKIRPAVDRSFDVDDIKQAFEHLSKGGNFGKIVLTF
ncbi:MAG: zinc-dependent alcohol dehydrogenase family protein [Sulfobacillus sp.]